MVKKHTKRIAAPQHWPIGRKKNKWVSRPASGPHPLRSCITINILIKNILKYAKTTREAKKIINSEKIQIDGIVRKDHRFPIGLLDVVSIKDTNENYRLFLNRKGKFIIHPIAKEESLIKPLKIINKKMLKGKKTQLNFYDGRNIIVDKDSYKVSDTILFDTHKKTVLDHYKLEKGALIYLTKGSQIGEVGIVDSVITFKNPEPTKVVFLNKNKKFETLKEYVFVIGKEKSVVSLPQQNEA